MRPLPSKLICIIQDELKSFTASSFLSTLEIIKDYRPLFFINCIICPAVCSASWTQSLIGAEPIKGVSQGVLGTPYLIMGLR
jgi:hypothetical protein